ncbi:MAG: hypothetical protein IT580_08320 [Verrucomicrobiales bacterium]|nr:hypothetical protein [Verrucomicrobiales bacterium]
MKSGSLKARRLLLMMVVVVVTSPAAQGDRFSWENNLVATGDFNNPQNWHGPNFPQYTRFPGANDDATISGSPRVIVSGDQATRELVTGSPTLEIQGTYTVDTFFGQGSPVTMLGSGALHVQRFQLGSQTVFEGAQAEINTLEPLGSELVVRGNAVVHSRDLDLGRGALTVRVQGDGGVWRHDRDLPFVSIWLRNSGRAELTSTAGVFVDAEGVGTRLQVSGAFRGYGRVASGARWECAEGIQDDHPVIIEGGTWAIAGPYLNHGTELHIRNRGVLTAHQVRRGDLSFVATIEGEGSRMEVRELVSSTGSYRLHDGGVLAVTTAELVTGGVSAWTGGSLEVAEDLYSNTGVTLSDGGKLTAGEVFLGDTPGRFGFLQVRDANSRATLSGALAVGQRGEGQLNVLNGAALTSRLGGFGIFRGADGQGQVSGAGSRWTLQAPVNGGALLIGGEGKGSLQVNGGGVVEIATAAEVVLGRELGSDGTLYLAGRGSRVAMDPAVLIVGGRGRGRVTIEDAAGLAATRLSLGGADRENSVTVSGADSALGVSGEMLVGEGGRGTLVLQQGAVGRVGRLAIGRQSLHDNQVVVAGLGTRLAAAGRLDVGEFQGRGSLVVSDTAQVRPQAGFSVGIYDGSVGKAAMERGGALVTPQPIIVGGGAGSQATLEIRNGSTLEALDILLFARTSGTATLIVDGATASVEAGQDLQIGFARGAAGPCTLVSSNGALVSVGRELTIGSQGSLDATGARVTVGAASVPGVGVVRVGTGGTLLGSGRVIGRVEVMAGGKASPGASPGLLAIRGSAELQQGSILECEIAGSVAGAEYDVLDVEGTVSLGGELVLVFADGFAPKRADRFSLVRARAGVENAFAAVRVLGLAPGFTYDLVKTGTGELQLVSTSDAVADSAPRLFFARGQDALMLSWWATAGATLESRPPTGGGWLPVRELPVRDGERFRVSIPWTDPARIFRLRR